MTEGPKEYTFDDIASLIHEELPELGFTRSTVYQWVVVRNLAAYRKFRRYPTGKQMTYRVNEENKEKILNIAREWAKEVREGATNGS